MTRILILLLLLYLTPLFSQEKNLNRKVSIGNFQPIDSNSNSSLESKINSRLTQKLEEQNIVAKKVKGSSIAPMLTNAKNQDTPILVTGFYNKKSPESNLDLYVQIYDVDKRQIIDAYTITDEIYREMDIELDPNEMKESDDARISKLVDKTTLMVRANPNNKEKRENINEHVLPHKIKDRVSPFISSSEQAEEQAVDEVSSYAKIIVEKIMVKCK